jgi:hypothetical protein
LPFEHPRIEVPQAHPLLPNSVCTRLLTLYSSNVHVIDNEHAQR